MKFSAINFYIFILVNISLGLFYSGQAVAQSIETDGTTPTQPENCSSDCTIEGGLQQGNNLFHSFERFNVDVGIRVLFQDPGVANILGRVTGNELSEILGTLGVSGGDANLFLINPNGIIFGQDSSLDLNGSFLATTADAIRFGEQGLLDTTPNEIPLLTIDPSALSFAGGDRGIIRNESVAPAGEDFTGFEVSGLRVPDGKSLLLAGGNVIFDGGRANVFGGRVELGGLAGAGEIELDFSNTDQGNISLKFHNQFQRSNVLLTNEAFVNVSSEEGGDITINAKKITVTEESFLVAGIVGNLEIFGSKAGNISLDATEKIEITNNSKIVNQVVPAAQGNAGDIYVDSGSLFISNDSSINTSTFGRGDAGNINISVEKNIIIFSDIRIQSSVTEEAIGDAGNISIEANTISLDSGSQLATSVVGQGKGGNISLNVVDSFDIDGFGTDNFSSGIFTTTEEGGKGKAGNIVINTNNFKIADGGLVSSQTLNEGDGGSILINTNTLEAIDGGQIATSAASSGNAGNINLRVTDNLLLSGSESNFAERLADFEENVINEPPGNSGFFANVRSEASGAGGNINVAAGQLSIEDSAEINVSAAGTGAAGSLGIDAQNVSLDRGNITAETRVGEEGNITLNDADTLLLRNNSQITTNATQLATGGDITISSDGIALLDNSDITAKAVRGQGGNIQITTQGIFLEPDSEITAASELGIDGTVTFNTPDVDPTSGIFELPDVPLNAEAILAQNLCKSDDEIAKGSSFIITGKGGLTPTSEGSLSNRDRLVNWISRDDLEVSQGGTVGIRQREDSADKSYPDIQQSQGLAVAPDGSTWLTANAPKSTSQTTSMNHPDCQDSELKSK